MITETAVSSIGKFNAWQWLYRPKHVVKVEVNLRPSQSASLSWCQAPIWDTRTIFLSPWNFLQTVAVRYFVAPSPTRGRVRVAQLYPRALDSFFVASYDSQGYGGGILTRLHTGTRDGVPQTFANKWRALGRYNISIMRHMHDSKPPNRSTQHICLKRIKCKIIMDEVIWLSGRMFRI
jgi:hypothetical protein